MRKEKEERIQKFWAGLRFFNFSDVSIPVSVEGPTAEKRIFGKPEKESDESRMTGGVNVIKLVSKRFRQRIWLLL